MARVKTDPRVYKSLGDYIEEGVRRGMTGEQIARWVSEEKQVRITPRGYVTPGVTPNDPKALGDIVMAFDDFKKIAVEPYGVPYEVVELPKSYQTVGGYTRDLITVKSLTSGRKAWFIPEHLIHVRLG